MEADQPVWIRGPHLRKRWGDPGRPMPNSTFHDRRKKGLIPEPEFPFGPDTPYWRLAVIEAHERKAQGSSEAPPVTPPEAAPVKRKPGRPRKNADTVPPAGVGA